MWHGERPEGVPKGSTVAQSPERDAKEGCGTARKAPRRAHTDEVPQQQHEVAAGDVHERPLQDVRMPAMMRPGICPLPLRVSSVSGLARRPPGGLPPPRG